jgi:hypothetical protein
MQGKNPFAKKPSSLKKVYHKSKNTNTAKTRKT